MKRKKLEKIWSVFVIFILTILCVIGVIAMFDENPLLYMKYVFGITIISIPINFIIGYFIINAKD